MVEIINYKNDFHNQVLLNYLTEFLEKILSDFKHDNSDVNLVLCDDLFIRNLNKQYRGKDSPTDVLSFSMLEGEDPADMFDEEADTIPEGMESGPSGSIILGDIIISIDQAEKQSKEFSVTFEEELARLAVHGLLHLLGFDHEKSGEDEKAMFKKQDNYVAEFLNSYSH